MKLVEHLQTEDDITCSEYTVQQAALLIARIKSENPGLKSIAAIKEKFAEEQIPREICNAALTFLQAAEELTELGYPPKTLNVLAIIQSVEDLIEVKKDFRINGILRTVKLRFGKVLNVDRRTRPGTDKIKRVVRRTPAMMLQIYPDGNFSSMNPQIYHTLGYTDEDMPESLFEIIDPDQIERFKRSLAQMLKSEISASTQEFTVRTKSGEEIPVLIALGNLDNIDNGNGTTSLVGTMLDISEIKRMEEQHIQAEALKFLGGIAAGVAHDFNNLLTVIYGYAESLRIDSTNLDPQISEGLLEIKNAARRARNLVASILRACRQEELKPTPCDVNGLIRDQHSLNTILVKPPHKLRYELSEQTMITEIKAQRIERVLQNLVKNAVEALLPKGGTVTIRTYIADIEENSHEHVCVITDEYITGSFIVIEVNDNGSGIEPHVKQEMFSPFFTTKPADKGTGLGLSMCRTFLHEAGVFLEVDSKHGMGTSFKIYFRPYQKKIDN